MNGRRFKEWTSRGRVEQAAASDQIRAERARALLGAAKARARLAAPQALIRPGVASSTLLHYALTSDPQRWICAAAGRPIIDAITAAAIDGQDRLIFPWPNRIGGAFVATAIALQETRTSGSLAHATFGYWPWRSGATFAARTVLVNPIDLRASARNVSKDVLAHASWVNPALAHSDRAFVELRFNELIEKTAIADHISPTPVVVRSPNLFEITPTFGPRPDESASYAPTKDHFFYRVRNHTLIGRLSMSARLARLDDPLATPIAVFGLPAETEPENLLPLLNYRRFGQIGLDVVVVDLTSVARQAFPETWERGFAALLTALDRVPGRRPALAIVVEDAFALKIASKNLRAHNSTISPRRALPAEVGVYIPHRGLLSTETALPCDLPPVTFEPDIKDAALAPLRTRLLALGSTLRQEGGQAAGEATSQALRFLRRVASLPVGLDEARRIADLVYAEETDGDRSARSAFRPKMELAPLVGVGDRYPAFRGEAERLAAEIAQRVEGWGEETPVSAKLTSILNAGRTCAGDAMIAVPSERIRDVLLLSDRAMNWTAEVVAANDLQARLFAVQPCRLVVVGPSPEIIRVLLTSPNLPSAVTLIGDTAGISLLKSEIWPIAHMDAFRPLAARAEGLQAALGRGGGDERLDLLEAAFRQTGPAVLREVDFTRAGDDYRGDIIHIATERGGRFAYRPASDVLVHSPSEVRPFMRRDARSIRPDELILALTDNIREKLRQSLFGTRRMREILMPYHNYIGQTRAHLPGTAIIDKSRYILFQMQALDPTVAGKEILNVKRWITADLAECDAAGYRMPGAARDWHRFHLFACAIGMPDVLARGYWDAVVKRTRTDRVQEGHGFNQQVVQFVLDPEAVALSAGVMAKLPDLWQIVLNAVDAVETVNIERRAGNGSHV